jgi:hypothetical protein
VGDVSRAQGVGRHDRQHLVSLDRHGLQLIVYWAADLQAGSTYEDRSEFANRVMEILDKHSNWSSSGKQDHCEIIEHHERRGFINADCRN